MIDDYQSTIDNDREAFFTLNNYFAIRLLLKTVLIICENCSILDHI